MLLTQSLALLPCRCGSLQPWAISVKDGDKLLDFGHSSDVSVTHYFIQKGILTLPAVDKFGFSNLYIIKVEYIYIFSFCKRYLAVLTLETKILLSDNYIERDNWRRLLLRLPQLSHWTLWSCGWVHTNEAHAEICARQAGISIALPNYSCRGNAHAILS